MLNWIGIFEFVLVFGGAIAWGLWEYRKTDALHKKTLEEERARSAGENAD